MRLERRGWIIQPDSEVNHFMGGTGEEGEAVNKGRIMGAG